MQAGPTPDNAPKIITFGRFWWESIKEAFSFGWLIFGVLSTAMPAIVTFVHDHFETVAEIPFIKWISEKQADIQLWIVGALVLSYLVYAPYKSYKSHALATKALLAEKDEQIAALSVKKSKQAVRDKLAQMLWDLERRLATIRNMDIFEYRDSLKDGKDEETTFVLAQIGTYLNWEVGTDKAITFNSAIDFTPSPVDPLIKSSDSYQLCRPLWNAKLGTIDQLVYYAKKLHKIIEEHE